MKGSIVFRKNGIYERAVEIAMSEIGEQAKEIYVLAFEPNTSLEEIREKGYEAMERNDIPCMLFGQVEPGFPSLRTFLMDATCMRQLCWGFSRDREIVERDSEFMLDVMISSRGSNDGNHDGVRKLNKKHRAQRILVVRENLEDHAHSVGGNAEAFWSEFLKSSTGITPEIVAFDDLPKDLDETTWVVQDRHCKFAGLWPNAPVILEIPSENLAPSLIRFGIGECDSSIRTLANSIKEWAVRFFR